MNDHTIQLDVNSLISYWKGFWISLLLLSTKSHQEKYNNINEFIWFLYVSYRSLNHITRSFGFQFPRYTDSIEDVRDSYGYTYFLSRNTRIYYNQICTRCCVQDKQAFSAPNDI